jgi:hypothetical protein
MRSCTNNLRPVHCIISFCCKINQEEEEEEEAEKVNREAQVVSFHPRTYMFRRGEEGR